MLKSKKMKKITKILLAGVLCLFLASCSKKDAVKDLDFSLKKLEVFNEKFDELFKDGVISTEAKGDEKSEYDQLKTLAGEYYESINKINTALKEGDEDYVAAHKKALEEKQADIDKLTAKFMENLEKMAPAETETEMELEVISDTTVVE
ncbi:MAG: hypothetical protein A2W91_09445 [Bacteroidetes bacterium GWF2_38_335]|nr:MAG: hypothetical protein A2W91_09445 [Bacteroidetes bacterium GWF2_38_335]OFY80808.1 MAG: hypothetical protein A2281_09055 [Bacteroidetes bacterium RIFOXYA12_FULL_38_20]HBS86208.1 hypothetical protein [Bacteroidales bacterium]